MNRVQWLMLLVLLAVGGWSSVIGCSSSTVRYQPYHGAGLPMEQGLGDWSDIALARDPPPEVWTLPHDTLAEIEFDRYRTETVSYNSSPSTQNSNLRRRTGWRPAVNPASCPESVRIIPADSIRPARFYCPTNPGYRQPLQFQTTTRHIPNDLAEIQRMAWKLGGHAVIITTVTDDLVWGYVIRCRVEEGVARCI